MMTFRQKQLLDFICDYQRRTGGITPSYTEMQEALQLKSKSSVCGLVDALEERGFLRRLKHRARAIQIVDPTRAHLFRFDNARKELVPHAPAQEAAE